LGITGIRNSVLEQPDSKKPFLHIPKSKNYQFGFFGKIKIKNHNQRIVESNYFKKPKRIDNFL
jgi:hypothetical protein